MLSKDTKVKIHRTIILSVVLYGCGTWSLSLREEHMLTVVKNRVLRKIFGPKWDDVTGDWKGSLCMLSSFTICTLHQVLLR